MESFEDWQAKQQAAAELSRREQKAAARNKAKAKARSRKGKKR